MTKYEVSKDDKKGEMRMDSKKISDVQYGGNKAQQKRLKCEIYRDSMQNYKKYAIPPPPS